MTRNQIRHKARNEYRRVWTWRQTLEQAKGWMQRAQEKRFWRALRNLSRAGYVLVPPVGAVLGQ